MLSQTLTIARNTFVESVRQPIYFIIIALAGMSQVFTTWTAAYSMGYTETGEVSGDDKVLLDVGMATVFVCGLLLSAFLATAVISKEIERKTVLTVVSKPVSRTAVVLGKYVGVAGAILIAVLTMLLFLLLSLRHKVMSTAADALDGPVIVFALAAVAVSIGAAVWCNYFYGWVFTQTCTMLLFPLTLLAYLGVLLVGKGWNPQPIPTDFKPQIALASVSMVCAQMVLAGVATAASARLGQVMTIVVCCGVFLLGMVSNWFIGRHAVQNEFLSRIASAEPELIGMRSLRTPGDTYTVTLEFDPRVRVAPGASFYYGENPNGWALAVRDFPPFTGDVNDRARLTDLAEPPALIVTATNGKKFAVLRAGGTGDRAEFPSRPPRAGDYLFSRPTRYNAIALSLWSVLPNFQYFWLVDAVSQNQKIPPAHVGRVALYSVCMIGGLLSLAVALFQTREVG